MLDSVSSHLASKLEYAFDYVMFKHFTTLILSFFFSEINRHHMHELLSHMNLNHLSNNGRPVSIVVMADVETKQDFLLSVIGKICVTVFAPSEVVVMFFTQNNWLVQCFFSLK